MQDISEHGSDGFIKKLIPSLFADPVKHAEIIKMLVARGLYYDDNAWCYGTQAIRDRNDHTDTLKSAKIPVLMLMGEQDKAVTPEIAYKQAPLSERVDLHMYPDVGHMSMYENPAAVIQDLIRFYDGMAA
jgi:pimeloyl-ACP methyl ester carboxylesterase